jgi:hypothetical protein
MFEIATGYSEYFFTKRNSPDRTIRAVMNTAYYS